MHTSSQPGLPAPDLTQFSLTGSFPDQALRLHSRTMMLALSFAIEDQVLLAPGAILIAAFQRFAYVVPQLKRYRRFTGASRQTYIFGLLDAELPSLPNVTQVPFTPASPLLHEWVVLVLGSNCSVGLFARDPDHTQPAMRSTHYQGTLVTDIERLDAIGRMLEPVLGREIVPPERNMDATRASVSRVQAALRAAMRKA